MQEGKVTQVIGPVVDVSFEGDMPDIFHALEIAMQKDKLILEVQQHLGSGSVRTVAMSSTDGLRRGAKVVNTNKPISVPVGKETLGRMLNVIGEPIDNKPAVQSKKTYPIHRPAPKFVDQSTKTEVFETGIKVIDLICPIIKGGKVGLFGGAGVGKTVVIQELIRNIA